MPIRIIAGTAKGRYIKVPKDGSIIRPALAQVREAIFSSLGDISGLHFMDIFAGTGSLGLEALSRDAEFCHFVDGNDVSIRLLIENLKLLGFEKQAKIHKRKMPHGLSSVKCPRPCDIVFCDPPYEKNLINSTLTGILKNNLVAKEGMVLVEHNKNEIPQTPGFEVFKTKAFGQTYITFLKPLYAKE